PDVQLRVPNPSRRRLDVPQPARRARRSDRWLPRAFCQWGWGFVDQTSLTRRLSSDLTLEVMGSRADLQRVAARCGERIAYEARLADPGRHHEAWTVVGYCHACEPACHS